METFLILPHTKDAISCLYYVRSELTQGQGGPLTMNVHHVLKTIRWMSSLTSWSA